MAQGYDDRRRKAGEKGINGSTVAERESEVVGNLEQCLADFEWVDVRLDSVKGMSSAEVNYMLKNCAWREVT